jgi:hypothetical protein
MKISDPYFAYKYELKTGKLTIISNNIYYKKEIIGTSRLGIPIYEIEITAAFSKKHKPIVNYENRKIIYIVAR